MPKSLPTFPCESLNAAPLRGRRSIGRRSRLRPAFAGNAGWELYIELITRVSTQRLLPEEGGEAAALTSIHNLFALTRETIKRHGRYSINFTRIAVVVLNQKVRPFTAQWHRRMLAGLLADADRQAFRAELDGLQTDLRNYTRLLADLADVEDLTDLEAV